MSHSSNRRSGSVDRQDDDASTLLPRSSGLSASISSSAPYSTHLPSHHHQRNLHAGEEEEHTRRIDHHHDKAMAIGPSNPDQLTRSLPNPHHHHPTTTTSAPLTMRIYHQPKSRHQSDHHSESTIMHLHHPSSPALVVNDMYAVTERMAQQTEQDQHTITTLQADLVDARSLIQDQCHLLSRLQKHLLALRAHEITPIPRATCWKEGSALLRRVQDAVIMLKQQHGRTQDALASRSTQVAVLQESLTSCEARAAQDHAKQEALQDQIATILAEKKALSSTMQELNQKLADTQETLIALAQAKQELEASLAELKVEHEAQSQTWTDRLTTLQSQLEHLQTQEQTLNTTLAGMTQELEVTRDSMGESRSEAESLRVALTASRVEYDKLATQLESLQEKYGRVMQELKESKDSLVLAQATHRTEEQKWEADLANEKRHSLTQAGQIDTLQFKMDIECQKVEDLQEMLKSFKAFKSSASAEQLAMHEADLQKIRAEVKQTLTERDHLLSLCEDKDIKLSKLEERYQELKGELEDARGQNLSQTKETRAKFEAEMQKVKADLALVTAERDRASLSACDAAAHDETEIQELKVKLKVSEAEVERLKSVLAEAEARQGQDAELLLELRSTTERLEAALRAEQQAKAESTAKLETTETESITAWKRILDKKEYEIHMKEDEIKLLTERLKQASAVVATRNDAPEKRPLIPRVPLSMIAGSSPFESPAVAGGRTPGSSAHRLLNLASNLPRPKSVTRSNASSSGQSHGPPLQVSDVLDEAAFQPENDVSQAAPVDAPIKENTPSLLSNLSRRTSKKSKRAGLASAHHGARKKRQLSFEEVQEDIFDFPAS